VGPVVGGTVVGVDVSVGDIVGVDVSVGGRVGVDVGGSVGEISTGVSVSLGRVGPEAAAEDVLSATLAVAVAASAATVAVPFVV
jgi:hypothetical protein